MTTRRGFTLVELLLAMIMLAVVAGLVYTMLIRTQRLSQYQAEQSNLQENVRAGGLILPAELREVGYDAGAADLIEIASDHVRFRAMRGLGVTCSIQQNQINVWKPISGYRDVTTNDSISYFIERDPNLAADDVWMPIGITAIDAGANCGGSPAIALTLGDSGLGGSNMASTFIGGPVRFYEVMQFGLYTVDGRSWLGARSVSRGEAYQPVLGPLADGNGVEFKYYDAANNEVTNRDAVRMIGITLRGRSDAPVTVGTAGRQILNFNMTTWVALRNTLRP